MEPPQPVARAPAAVQQGNPQVPSQAQAAPPPPVQPAGGASGPNANPLNLFPQVCVNVNCYLYIWRLVL